jgi:hypothetical protein
MLGDGALAPGQTVAGQVGLSLAWSGGSWRYRISTRCADRADERRRGSDAVMSIDWAATEACTLHTCRPEAELLGGW